MYSGASGGDELGLFSFTERVLLDQHLANISPVATAIKIYLRKTAFSTISASPWGNFTSFITRLMLWDCYIYWMWHHIVDKERNVFILISFM